MFFLSPWDNVATGWASRKAFFIAGRGYNFDADGAAGFELPPPSGQVVLHAAA
jgi:hypothetical protein